MKETMSSIDIIAAISEIKGIQGCKVQKIYHEVPEILLYLYSTETREKILRIIPSKAIHVTEYKREHRKYPTNFCMFLRKYLSNSTIVSIEQPNKERIVRIVFRRAEEEFNMIIELFSKGNVILCRDDMIIHPLMVQRWKDRTIKAKEKYKFPPSLFDMGSADVSSFSRAVLGSEKKDIVRTLAIDIGLGGPYAEELCSRAGLVKTTSARDLGPSDTKKLWKHLKDMMKQAKKPIGVVWESDVTPFEMDIYSGKKQKRFPSFNEALDSYFTENFIKKGKHIEEGKKQEEVQRLRKRIEDQREIVEEYRKKADASRRTAELLANNLDVVKNIIRSLNSAREQYPWDRVIQIVEEEKSRDVYEANVIKQIIPEEGKVILDLGEDIEIDITRNPADIMDDYYELAKKSESKIIGAREAILRTETEIEKAKKKEVKLIEPKPIVKKKRKHWYDNFLWVKSSDDFLVVSGKDAVQNEILIKKHMEVSDLVFHADIHGSPFTIVKNGREAGENTLKEAAAHTAVYSKAWESNMAVDVYYVQPYQVTKSAPSGEYIKKGGFMVRGKKNYVKDIKPELAIGLSKDLGVIAGPRRAIIKNALYYIILTPGNTPTGTIAKEVREAILKKIPEAERIPLEEIQKFIPGKSMIIRR